jgi:predicted acylesterase/phospholipase RssA
MSSPEAGTVGGRPRRSLILAGGGVKVAFQGGTLQVLLDETDLEFDHIDGASGGSLNLAMVCQGMAGREIADNWRHYGPLQITQPNPGLLLGESIARLERLRDNGFTDWGLDFEAIRASTLDATFNVYDFSRHELLVLPPADMSPEMLMACVCLPMWFPPVERAGDKLIDPVFITDANLDTALERGADELWIVWTVSRRGRWRRGFIHHYFQIIETAGYGRFKRDVAAIEESNRAFAEGRHSRYGRHVEVKVLYGEVPVHYLVNFRRAPFRRAVEQGVEAARAWCEHEGVLRADVPAPEPAPRRTPKTVRFTEVMAGSVAFGERDPERGATAAAEARSPLKFRLTMYMDDLDRFLADRDHEAPAAGYVDCPALGGRSVVSRGRFNLFTTGEDPRTRFMLYRLFFRDGEGAPLTLTGIKRVHDDPGADAWADATTLYTRVLRGHVAAGEDEAAAIVAAGILRITPPAFARQLTTFRGTGPGPLGGLRAVLRFGAAFLGQLRQVFGPKFLTGG